MLVNCFRCEFSHPNPNYARAKNARLYSWWLNALGKTVSRHSTPWSLTMTCRIPLILLSFKLHLDWWFDHFLRLQGILTVKSCNLLCILLSSFSFSGCTSNTEKLVHGEWQRPTFRCDSCALCGYSRSGVKLTIYSDSDWARDSVDLKSYSCNAIFMNGDLVAWLTHK